MAEELNTEPSTPVQQPTPDAGTPNEADIQAKRHSVSNFIKKLEKQTNSKEYQEYIKKMNRAKRDFKEFMDLPKDIRSKILFKIQTQIISHEVEVNPDSPYNWRRIEKEERMRENEDRMRKIAGELGLGVRSK
jgi:hypothetical protein